MRKEKQQKKVNQVSHLNLDSRHFLLLSHTQFALDFCSKLSWYKHKQHTHTHRSILSCLVQITDHLPPVCVRECIGQAPNNRFVQSLWAACFESSSSLVELRFFFVFCVLCFPSDTNDNFRFFLSFIVSILCLFVGRCRCRCLPPVMFRFVCGGISFFDYYFVEDIIINMDGWIKCGV